MKVAGIRVRSARNTGYTSKNSEYQQASVALVWGPSERISFDVLTYLKEGDSW